MDDLVSAEQCIENAVVPLNTVERVAEERVASAGRSENVCVTNIPDVPVLCREETIPLSACVEQNPLGNQYHIVTSLRSEQHINFIQRCRGSIVDSACESQVLNMSAITEQIQLSASLYNISADRTEEATRSEKQIQLSASLYNISADRIEEATRSEKQIQLSASLYNISADGIEEATRSEKDREHYPEIEMVSFMLVLSHL